MEFFISTSDAQSAVKHLSVTAKPNATTFEGQVFIQTGDDTVTFTSRNTSSGLSCTYPAKIVKPGQANILYSKMKTFLMTIAPWDGEIGAKEFHFEVVHPKLVISVEVSYDGRISKSNLKLNQHKVSAFLSPVVMGDESNLILKSGILRTAIDKGVYAIDPVGTSVFTRGMRMVLKDKKVLFTATNGKVVAEYMESSDNSSVEGEFFLPHEFLLGLRRILVDDTDLFFDITKNKIKISFDNILFWASSLSYDRWPSTDEVWKNYDKTIEFRRDILLTGIQSFVDILDPADYHRVTLKKEADKFNLIADDADFEYPPIEELGPEEFVVDINGLDFMKSLGALSEEMIKLRCLDSETGVILESDGFDKQKAFITNLTLKKRD